MTAPGADRGAANDHNRDYLRTKRDRMEHLLHHQGLALDEELDLQERQLDAARAATTEGTA